MEIKIECADCGKDVFVDSSKMIALAGKPETVILRVSHECKIEEKICTLSEALLWVKEEPVEIAYYKKDGQFRSMVGYFPGSVAIRSKIGYEFFLEKVSGAPEGSCCAPKNLIRRSISSITRLSDGFTYLIG